MSGVKFGLSFGKKGPPKPAPAKKASALFGGDDEEDGPTAEGEDNAMTITSLDDKTPLEGAAARPPSKPPKSKRGLVIGGPDLSSLRTQQKHLEQAQDIDPSVFDYDSHYDAIHARDEAKKAAARQEALERKPKYMSNLLASAEQREKDRMRAKDKLLQKEREAEGEEFADKEQFVTGAYKKQQEETRRAEEEEKRRDEEEDKKRASKGMAGFYRNVMDEQEKRHQEIMEAAANAPKNVAANDSTGTPQEKTAAEQAKDLNARGANIDLNEEGEVVDKRQLLKGGLNISTTQKAKDAQRAATASTTNTSASARPLDRSADRSRKDARKAQRDRQTRMIEAQLEAHAKRAAEEEAEELQKRERDAKSRKTEGEISSAKERYLQRKREAAAATSKPA